MLSKTNTINSFWLGRIGIVSLLFAGAITVSEAIGYYCFLGWTSFYSTETLARIIITFLLVLMISYTVFFFVCTHVFSHAQTGRESLKRQVVAYSGIIFLCWMPYLVLRYPGIIHLDTIEQIIEFFSPEKTWYFWQISNHDITSGHMLLNHHPILTTMIFSVFYKLGLIIGDISAGLFIYTVIQAACMALSFGFSIAYLRYCGISRLLAAVFCLYFAICPVNGINATIIVKDNLFIICIVLMQIGLVELLRNEEAFLLNRKYCILFGILMLFLSFSRHNGLYICACLAIIFFFAYRKKGTLLKTCSCLAVVTIVITNSLLLPAAGVTPSSSKEALSVPLQQMGRYINEHLDEIGTEDRVVFEECLFPKVTLENIADSYQPSAADGVKDRVKAHLSANEKKRLGMLWTKWFFDDEMCYINATLNMVYPAFKTFSGEQGTIPDSTIITTSVADWINNDETNNSLFHTEQNIGLDRENMRFFSLSLAIDDKILNKIMTAWGIRAFFQMDFYVWLMLAVFAVLIIKRQYKGIIVLSAVGINFLITLLGPIMYMRYFYPIVCCLPLLISYALLMEVKKDRS